MKGIRKAGFAAGILAVLILWMGAAAYGADSSIIEKVTVAFKTTYGDPEEIPDPEITVSGTGCSLGDVQYRTSYDNWKPGKKVRAEVTVKAAAGKYFPVSLNRSQCNVTGAEFVSARALDNSTLQVKVDYRPVTVLGATEHAGWSSTSKKKAVWKSVAYAPGYSLTLYGDDKVVKRLTVDVNNVGLSDYMQDMDKTYYYEVKAVPLTADQKKYLKDGENVTSTDQEFDYDDYEKEAQSQGPGDGGSFKGDNYIMPDGGKAVNTWKMVSGNWYYFDGSGSRAKGWLNYGNIWYYLDQNGVMCTNWVNVNGIWYYLDSQGAMQTGWILPMPGTWYYLDPSGAMQTGWTNVNNKWYYMNQSGAMQTGWLNDNGKWYYLNSDGSMAVNTSVEGWSIGPDGAAPERS